MQSRFGCFRTCKLTLTRVHSYSVVRVRHLHFAMLLAATICGPAWGADPVPPDEAAPFDIRTVTINGQEMRVHDFRDPNAGLPWLNARLHEVHKAGVLQSCSYLAGVYLTRYEQAYGAICRLKDGEQVSDVKVCADTAVGNFSLMPLGAGAKTGGAIAEFVAASCAGG